MGRASKGRETEEATPAIVMVRPQLGENIGMAARAMLNCGLSTLRLVAPREGWPNARAQRAAPSLHSQLPAPARDEGTTAWIEHRIPGIAGAKE